MGNKTRNTSNLVSDNNIFVDISNDRVGIGSTQPTTKLDVVGTVKATSFSGITTSMISDYGNGLAGGYSNSNVDTHLNTGTASSGQILSWNGSDYAWVADQTGGGGGGGGDAATLDGIDSTQFLRSDAADTKTSGHLDFVDGVYARFGTGQDLQIYHNGNHSYVNDTGTGNLYIGGNQIWINDANNTNVSAVFNPTSYSALYYNSSKKFETTGAGVTVTGTAFSNQLNVSGVSTFSSDVSVNAKLKLPDGSSSANYAGFGNNDDLKIFHNGAHSIVRETGTGSLYLQSDDNVILGKDSNTEIMVKGVADGAVELYYDNVKKFETTGYGVTITGGLNVSGVTTFQSTVNLGDNDRLNFSNTNTRIYGGNGALNIESSGTHDILIKSNSDGATHGNVEIGTGADGGKVYLTGTGGVGIYHTDTALKLETTASGIDVTGHTETDTLNVSGVATASSFTGNLTGIASTATTVAATVDGTTASAYKIPYLNTTSNSSGNYEILFESGGLTYQPSNNQLTVSTISLSEIFVSNYIGLNDDDQIRIGSSNDARLFYDGTANDFEVTLGPAANKIAITDNGTYKHLITRDGKVGINTSVTPTVELNVVGDANITGVITATSFSGITTSMISDYGNGLAGGYSNTNVDTHLNTSTASSGEVLSWTGTDYDWVAQSGGGSGFSPDSQENLYSGTGAGAASDADTCFNIGIGYSAGASLNSGDNNIFLGCCAGNSTTCGYSNVFLGTKAGANHTSGNYNVAIGQCANASGTTTGQHNVFVGCGAGDCVTSGCDNVYLGRGAGNDVTTARCNIALGFYAGSSNLAGIHNIFLGNNAGGNSSSGNCNINIGQRTGFCNAGGNLNNFIGYYAGFSNTTGCFNNYFGYAAGYCNCTGSGNNFFGQNSGFDFSSGSNNVFIGYYSGKLQTSGDCNIAIGHNACLPNKTGSSQLAIGAGSTNWISGDSSFNVTVNCITATKFCGDGSCLTGLSAAGFSPDSQENLYAGTSTGTSSSNACFNIGIGYSAANALSIGDCNVFLGAYAGTNVDTGDSVFIGRNAGKGQSGSSNIANVFIGSSTGCCITTGSFNVFLGCGAGKKVTTGQYNISLGLGAGQSNCTGRYNVNIGANAGSSNTSCYNVFLGAYAGGGITGSHNIFIGCCSGCNPSTGDRNIVIGNNAACSISNNADYNVFLGEYAGHTTTSGSNNVAIGYSVALPSATGSCQFAIGNGTNRWIYGDSNFNIYDKDGNQLNGSGGGGGGLSYFTESENTSSPNNTVAANRFLATGSGTNIDAVFQPKGTGAFLAQLPDSATTGGNKRGCYAVDLQMIRPAAACVASGPFASIAGGCGNKAGECGFVGGGVLNSASYWGSVTGGCSNSANSNWAHVGGGHANSAGYAAVVAGGQSNNAGTYASVLGGMGNRATGYMAAVVGTRGSCANGDCSVAIGYQACNHGRHGSIAIGAGAGIFGGNLAKIQYSIMNIGRDTTDATQTVLHAEGSSCSAASDNQLHLKNNSAYLFSGQVIANVTGGGDTHAWEFSGVIKKGTGNVALVGTPNINDIGYDSGASGWSIAVCADTSNASLAVCVTGQASTNIRWGATLRTTEIMH